MPDTENTERREALKVPWSSVGNVNNSLVQLQQNERNGHFYLEVLEEPFRQGLWLIPWEIGSFWLLAWDS